jgi:hypothetical protein
MPGPWAEPYVGFKPGNDAGLPTTQRRFEDHQMPTLANDLVLFLMSLFGNHKAAQEFLDDPERSLEHAGLGGVCSADVDAALPVVLDYAPITVNASSFDRSYNTGGNGAATGGGAVAVTPPPFGGGNGDHTHAVQQLHNVVNNYSYTSTVDDRDTITDQSVNQNIWADGDVEQWFDNDAVVASGDRAVAADDDVDMDDSNNIEDSYNTDNSNDSSTDNSVNAGRDADVGNTDTDIDDSFNTDLDLDVADSFNDNSDNSTDNSEETDVDVEDSFNDDSVEVTDNSDQSVHTDVDVAVEDSFQDSREETNTTENTAVSIDDSFDPVEIEDSFTQETLTNTETETETVVAVVGDDAEIA